MLTQLVLTDNETEKNKWVNALQHLHKMLTESQDTSKTVSITSLYCEERKYFWNDHVLVSVVLSKTSLPAHAGCVQGPTPWPASTTSL